MFLRNYDNMLVLQHFSTEMWDTNGPRVVQENTSPQSIGPGNAWGEGYFNVKSSNGGVGGLYRGIYNSFKECSVLMTSLNKYSICIGTGNAEVAYDDFMLSGTPLDNTKLSYVSNNWEYDADTHKVKATATYSYTNTSAETITIAEWGLFCNSYYDGPSGSNSKKPFNNNNAYHILVYREVLDEPIVIEPGTTATLTFSVEIPMPNHP